MNDNRPAKAKKSVVMSFAVDEEMAERIRQIPSHTTWIRDLVAKDLAICPVCRQTIAGLKKEQ